MIASRKADTVVGNDDANRVEGGKGYDKLYGEDGNDTLYGQVGRDEIYGGDDDDHLYGGSDDDTLAGDNGDNVVLGGSGDDLLLGGTGTDDFDGGVGNDTVYYSHGSGFVFLDLTTGGFGGLADGDTYHRVENVIGTGQSDFIRGNSNANHIVGHEGYAFAGGDDTIFGGAGNDTLEGTGEISGGSGQDVIIGNISGLVNTMAVYTGSSAAVDVDLSRLTQLGGDAHGDSLWDVQDVRGSRHNDTLEGNSLFNRLEGGDGNDILSGGGADDELVGGRGSDWLTGGQGSDEYYFDFNVNLYETDRITDFSHGDTIIIEVDRASPWTTLAEMFADAVQVRGDLVFDYGRGALVLEGMSLSQIDADDVLFV